MPWRPPLFVTSLWPRAFCRDPSCGRLTEFSLGSTSPVAGGAHSSDSAFPEKREWPPVVRIRVPGARSVLDHGQHGAAQSLGAASASIWLTSGVWDCSNLL